MTEAIMLLMIGMLQGTAGMLTLTATDWPPPHRADTLMPHKPLGDLLLAVEQHKTGVLHIRHAGGESGSRFAEQLRDALVAFGLPSDRVRLVPAAADSDQLILEFIVKGDTAP